MQTIALLIRAECPAMLDEQPGSPGETAFFRLVDALKVQYRADFPENGLPDIGRQTLAHAEGMLAEADLAILAFEDQEIAVFNSANLSRHQAENAAHQREQEAAHD